MKMKTPKLAELSPVQRQMWVSASVVFGLILTFMGVEADVFSDRDTRFVAILIFALCGLIVVFLLRLFVQQIDDPTDFKSIPILRRQRKR